MEPTQTYLPMDVWAYAISPFLSWGDLIRFALVSKNANEIVNQCVKRHWEFLKTTPTASFVDLSQQMKAIELESTPSHIAKLIKLYKWFENKGTIFPNTAPFPLVLPKLQDHLQCIQNHALLKLWPIVLTQLQNGSAQGVDADDVNAIRNWFDDITNHPALSQISELNLHNHGLHEHGLRDIPNEIKYFTGLQKLVLSNNRISDVTPLAGLTGSPSLDLSDNPIRDISSLDGWAGHIAL